MKILFIIPKSLGNYVKPTTPHIGVSYLAAYLIREGHAPNVFDMRLDTRFKNLKNKILDFKPDFLGITLVSKDYKAGYNLISQLKSEFSIPIIIGGPHPSTIRSKILEETNADFAIIGEGEVTLAELLNGKSPKTIKGLIWRNNAKIVSNPERPYIQDLNSLPLPAYDLFDLPKYVDYKKIRIVSSRGCPYNCTYCSIKLTMGKQFRARSAENVYKEIKHWYDLGYREFQFTDDNFTFDMKRAGDICDLIIKNNLKIQWDLRNGIRVNKINKELLKKFKHAGCFFIAYGVESADQKVLNAMKKGITVKQAEQAIKDTIDAGIETSAFFIIGSPKDTYLGFLKSLKFAKSFDLSEFRFYNLIPYPGTELFDFAKKNGYLLKDPSDYLNTTGYWESHPVIATPEFSAADREKAYNIGERYVMRKLLKKEFGPTLGTIGYKVWKNQVLRKFAMDPGIMLWGFIRKHRHS